MTPNASWDDCKALAARFPIASFYRRQFHTTQALWDTENAIAPVDEARPCVAGVIAGAVLLALVGIIGAAFIHTAF